MKYTVLKPAKKTKFISCNYAKLFTKEGVIKFVFKEIEFHWYISKMKTAIEQRLVCYIQNPQAKRINQNFVSVDLFKTH